MKQIISIFVSKFSIHPQNFIRKAKSALHYFSDLRKFQRAGGFSGVFSKGALFPCLYDWDDSAGVATGDYFNQDLYIAQRIFNNHPKTHIDVGSRFDGFVAHIASFMPIEVLDIRPLESHMKNIKFTQCNFMESIPAHLKGAYESVSSLHAIEHFGLGRYGDPIDPNGWQKGIENLKALLKPKGKLYFSVPIGPMRIEYNAHRVFSVKFLRDYFLQDYAIDIFSYVDNDGVLHENVTLDDSADLNNNFGCFYGCGIFELTKL